MKKVVFILLLLVLITLVHAPDESQANPAPPQPVEAITPTTADIEIIYAGTWPAAAQTALEYAAAIWEPLVSSIIPIKINATWGTSEFDPLARTLIASYTLSPNSPIPNVWYPSMLYWAIEGQTSCPTCEAMFITFDSTLPNWYFGTDGQPSPTQYDFVTVALRQIGLGLGFGHSFKYYPATGMGEWGSEYNSHLYPRIYDLFLYNQNNQQLINTANFPNPSTALYAQMTGNNIYFFGSRTVAANGNNPAKLYAPSTWGRDSFKYLDESTFATGTANALMTPVIQPGEVIHQPGPVVLAILYDMGWPPPNATPAFDPLPNQIVLVNTIRNNAIDLWAYVMDDQPDNELDFQIINSPAPQAGVSIDNNRFIDINPTLNWTGQTTVVIRVTDPYLATATRSFELLVADLPMALFLPHIQHP